LGLPAGRNGFQPQLRLVYSTGGGNGPFGLGWSLSVPMVSRKTSKGVPRYHDEAGDLGQRDTFVLSGAEDLVPVAEPRPGTTLPWSPTPPTPAGSSAGSCRGPPTRSAGAVGERRTFKADAARPAPLTFLVDTAGQHDRRWTRTSPGPISHSSKNVRTPPAQRRHSLVHGEGVAGKGGQLLGGGVELWTNS